MKLKFVTICITLLSLLLSCNKDDKPIKSHPIDGSWNLSATYGGYMPIEYKYLIGEVQWTFNYEDNSLMISENLKEQRIEKKYNFYYKPGKHSFAIKKENDSEVLFIDNVKIGDLFFSDNSFIIDDERIIADGPKNKFNKDTNRKNVNSTLIQKGDLFENEQFDKQNLIIKNQTDWNTLITKLNSSNTVIDASTAKEIDFSTHIVIASFLGIKTNGGHLLELGITADNQNIYITTADINPKGNEATVISQPFNILKIEKSDLPIVFE